MFCKRVEAHIDTKMRNNDTFFPSKTIAFKNKPPLLASTNFVAGQFKFIVDF